MSIKPIRKLLVANRSEIATRVFRAANELGLRTVAIYAKEDRFSMHRFKADESYQLNPDKGPVGAYLDIEGIITLAVAKGVDAMRQAKGGTWAVFSTKVYQMEEYDEFDTETVDDLKVALLGGQN